MTVLPLARSRPTVDDARELSASLLAGTSDRWRHTAGVAHRAAFVAEALRLGPEQARLVVMAAWLHDIGYARSLRDTGFHPVDGARFLGRGRCWPESVVGMVAYHSGAWFCAQIDGSADSLAEFPAPDGHLLDLLTFADQTVGPQGQTMTVPQRLAEMLQRQGPDSANARANAGRGPYLLDVERRVRRTLHAAGTPWPPRVIDLTSPAETESVLTLPGHSYSR